MQVLQEELLGTPEVSLTESLLVFAARSYGDLSSWHGNPRLGDVVWAWNLLIPELFLPNFCPPHVGVGPACSASLESPPSLHGCGFFNSVAVGLLFSWISDGCEWRWLYSL